jgi:hypothetical protein
VVGKVRDRLSVSKQTTQKLDKGIFNLTKLIEMKVMRFAVLEILDDTLDINMNWKGLDRITNFQSVRED